MSTATQPCRGAESALDGSGETYTYMHTQVNHTNPWWCADMGGIYHVTRVVVSNRKIDNPVKMNTNLRIGVTNTRPMVL